MSNETNTQDVSARLVGVKEPTRDDHAATKGYVDGHGASVDVTDGVTTVSAVTELDFTSGATVTDAGGGVAQVAVSGGSQPGTLSVVSFPFAFDTPNILTGVTALTPSVDDLLLDAWIECEVSWDSDTVPLVDIGVIHAGAFDPGGLFAAALGNPVNLNDTWNVGTDAVYPSSRASPLYTLAAASATAFGMFVPWRWTTTGPLTLIVNDTGAPGGANPVIVAGSGILRLVVCTP